MPETVQSDAGLSMGYSIKPIADRVINSFGEHSELRHHQALNLAVKGPVPIEDAISGDCSVYIRCMMHLTFMFHIAEQLNKLAFN